MKHIMLLFLSQVHLNRDRSLFVFPYTLPDGTVIDCVQPQEAALRRTAASLQKQGERLDCLFYFSTQRTQEAVQYIDDAGQERSLTHEAWFLEQVRPFVAHCIRIDYNEQSPTTESVRPVLEMADTIRSFLKEKGWQPEDVEIHADVTDDFCHALIMLSVIQLLKHYGIRATTILSSNSYEQPIENVTDIYRMFNLISGADAFINFGSTREIMAYMEGAEQTAESAALLQTMRDFTDAVRICRTGNIAPLAKELQTALKNFEQAGAVSFREDIFRRILTFFKREYGALLKEKVTHLDIIRWCVEKGYFQQAVTLCSEWIPGIIVARHIFYPIRPGIQTTCNQMRKKYQTWEHYFINTYTPKNVRKKTSIPAEEEDWRKVLFLFGQDEPTDRISKQYPEATAKLKPLLEDLFIGSRLLADMKKAGIDLLSIRSICPKTYAVLRSMYLTDSNVSPLRLSEATYFSRRRLKHICNYLAHAPSEVLQKFIPVDAVPPEDMEGDISVSIGDVPRLSRTEAAWNIRRKQYWRMMNYGIVQYGPSMKGALEILRDYFKIRAAGNHIHHVNAEDTLSKREVTDLVWGLLRRLEGRP